MRVVYDLQSPTCPIGAPSRDTMRNRNLKPPQQAAPKVDTPPTASSPNRRQGMVFNVKEFPKELKDLQSEAGSRKITQPA
ncbi:hypothetical protein PGT21_024662 [Puccinia graminis f. sp. tritici]|uniref:Uncharacterized protein n=1 Tax=Puccinia graminis f. sp. tritici TaxID=56615 RepID=A0A5B0R6T6_PUCGR|nr:hypothetical protein PGT21_024662 [Puccinia graminis f. sp. tritici]KAA1120979.1 hypothetical protein PGTUg99_024511 [Puccinia graminis f. sp. tritici]